MSEGRASHANKDFADPDSYTPVTGPLFEGFQLVKQVKYEAH